MVAITELTVIGLRRFDIEGQRDGAKDHVRPC
jgi:hypothetical protein